MRFATYLASLENLRVAATANRWRAIMHVRADTSIAPTTLSRGEAVADSAGNWESSHCNHPLRCD